MEKVKVNESRLKEVIEFWVEGFNDCACCPLSDDCSRRDEELGIDCKDCAEEIICYYLQSTY